MGKSQYVKWNILFSEISKCDSFLCQIQLTLATFQSKLSEISTEIQKLQSQSLDKNAKLKNRREVNEKLKCFLNKVALPESAIENILDVK